MSSSHADLRDRIARAIVAEFPPRSHPDNDDFAEALGYADAVLAALGRDTEIQKSVVSEWSRYRNALTVIAAWEHPDRSVRAYARDVLGGQDA